MESGTALPPGHMNLVLLKSLIVEGIFWVMQTSSSWRSLPTRFGAWSKGLHYYRQWRGDGRWERILGVLQIQDVPISSSA